MEQQTVIYRQHTSEGFVEAKAACELRLLLKKQKNKNKRQTDHFLCLDIKPTVTRTGFGGTTAVVRLTLFSNRDKAVIQRIGKTLKRVAYG